MTFAGLADCGLDYISCRYGTSKLAFRGPRRRLEGEFCAAVGGSETFGRFVERPFPDLVEDRIGMTVVNFGVPNAGVQGFSTDATVIAACRRARVVILQVTGAHNVSNDLYTVHPRRNDRFLQASPQLTALYPDVDFTEFHFTRHLLTSLAARDSGRFVTVREELRRAWIARMRMALRLIRKPVMLLWIAERSPDHESETARASDPLFIDRTALDALSRDVADLVEIVPSARALAHGRRGMIFSDLEAQAALELPNPAVHAEIADALADRVKRLF